MSPIRFSAVALAACALTNAATAQCGYQTFSPQCFSFAPPPTEAGNISDSLVLRSNKLTITGDIRVRSRTAPRVASAPYADGDQIASRARVNLDYEVDEHTNAFVQFNFSETWAGSDGYSDAQPGENFNGVAQAYVLADDVLGAGETLRIGRSYFTVGNSLIYGSCDFLQYPASGTGVWLSKHFGEHALELFGFDNNGTLLAAANGGRFLGATGRIDLGNETCRALEPWALFGTGEGDVNVKDNWYGLTATGAVGGDENGNAAWFDWIAEWAQRDVDVTDETRDAHRVIVSKDVSDMTGGVIERVRLTRTSSEGAMHINPGDFNTAGLLHQYGGAWRSEIETNQLGVRIKPTDNTDLDLAYINFHRPGDGNNELDAMFGAQIRNGLHAWIGYGRDEDDREVLFGQLTLFF